MSAQIESPPSGERIVWREVTAEKLVFDYHLAPGSYWPGARLMHIHPKQEERFEVVSGTPAFTVAGRKLRPPPGDVVVVPGGTVHRFRNAGDDELHLVVTFLPALRTKDVFEIGLGLRRDGKSGFGSIPRNPLRGAVFAHEYRDEVQLVPSMLTRPALAALSALGRTLGYTPYPEYVT